jgi:hypothetical protein
MVEVPADLSRGAGEGSPLAEGSLQSKRPFPSDDGRFQATAVSDDDRKRDETGLREEDGADRVARFKKRRTLLERDLIQVSF